MHPALLVFLVALINQVITWIGKDLIKDFVRRVVLCICADGPKGVQGLCDGL